MKKMIFSLMIASLSLTNSICGLSLFEKTQKDVDKVSKKLADAMQKGENAKINVSTDKNYSSVSDMQKALKEAKAAPTNLQSAINDLNKLIDKAKYAVKTAAQAVKNKDTQKREDLLTYLKSDAFKTALAEFAKRIKAGSFLRGGPATAPGGPPTGQRTVRIHNGLREEPVFTTITTSGDCKTAKVQKEETKSSAMNEYKFDNTCCFKKIEFFDQDNNPMANIKFGVISGKCSDIEVVLGIQKIKKNVVEGGSLWSLREVERLVDELQVKDISGKKFPNSTVTWRKWSEYSQAQPRYSWADRQSRTVLDKKFVEAAEIGDNDALKKMLDDIKDPGMKFDVINTKIDQKVIEGEGKANALHVATYKGKIETVKFLLDNRANPNVPTGTEKNTALMLALKANREDIAKLLLDHKASGKPQNREGQTAIFMTQDPGIMQLLVKAGADINHKDNRGYTTLSYNMSFSRHLNPRWVSKVLELGADPNIKVPANPIYGERTVLELAVGGRESMFSDEDIGALLDKTKKPLSKKILNEAKEDSRIKKIFEAHGVIFK